MLHGGGKKCKQKRRNSDYVKSAISVQVFREQTLVRVYISFGRTLLALAYKLVAFFRK